jgi:hypothetical protein
MNISVSDLFLTLVVALYLSLWVIPFLIGLLIALGIVRYREWLAILAVAGSMVSLAGNGDLLYNLTYMPLGRFGPLLVALLSLSFFAPLFLLILVFVRSRRRRSWALATLLLAPLTLVSMRGEFVTRGKRDAEAYRQGVKPLTPQTGTSFVRWWRDYRGLEQRILLQGHIPETSQVVLLTDPFNLSLQPHFCTGTASVYWPPQKDPTKLGNVTEVAGLQGCDQTWQSGVAALERTLTNYRALPFEPFSGAPDKRVPANPAVRQAFDKFGYDPANFIWSKTEVARAKGSRQAILFIAAFSPIKTLPNAFPCTGPSLLVGVQDLENIKVVLPYCTLSWNLFQLDDELYFAAFTQEPTPPGLEVMNPDQTQWLFRVEGTELRQLWPSP